MMPTTLQAANALIADQERRLQAFALACYAVVIDENRSIAAAHRAGLVRRRSAHGRLCLSILNQHINRSLRTDEWQAQLFAEQSDA